MSAQSAARGRRGVACPHHVPMWAAARRTFFRRRPNRSRGSRFYWVAVEGMMWVEIPVWRTRDGEPGRDERPGRGTEPVRSNARRCPEVAGTAGAGTGEGERPAADGTDHRASGAAL